MLTTHRKADLSSDVRPPQATPNAAGPETMPSQTPAATQDVGGGAAQDTAPVMSFWTENNAGDERQGKNAEAQKGQQAKATVWQLYSILAWLLGWQQQGGEAGQSNGQNGQAQQGEGAASQEPSQRERPTSTDAQQTGSTHAGKGPGKSGVEVQGGEPGGAAQVHTQEGQTAEVQPGAGATEIRTEGGDTVRVEATGDGTARVETSEGATAEVAPGQQGGARVETEGGQSTEIKPEAAGREPEAIPEAAPGQPGGPEIDATTAAMGKHVASAMDKANDGPHTLDKGIHYSYNYEALCKRSGQMNRWNDDYRSGYANPTYFEKVGWMDWVLKPGQSASAAIKAWLEGVTIAECNSSVVAMQIDALRAAIGDEKFDDMFGSPNKRVPDNKRLRVKSGTDGTPVANFMKSTELAEEKGWDGKATDKELDEGLNVGDWYYFYNHPKYLLKHPGGAWQGENALYMGKRGGQRIWSGLGASGMTEDGMMEEMVYAYNAPRDEHDERAMREYGIKNADGTYADRRYDPKSGEFEDKITKNKILNDPPYELHGTTRKGGFLVGAGIQLDAKKIAKLRDS